MLWDAWIIFLGNRFKIMSMDILYACVCKKLWPKHRQNYKSSHDRLNTRCSDVEYIYLSASVTKDIMLINRKGDAGKISKLDALEIKSTAREFASRWMESKYQNASLVYQVCVEFLN